MTLTIPPFVIPKCGDCGATMVLTSNRRRLDNQGTPVVFYTCTRYPLCHGAHAAHPDGSPMGTPADVATRRMRHRAHVELDAFVKEKGWDMPGTYRWLAKKMGLTKDQMHFGLFDSDQCALAIAVIKRHKRRK